MKINIRTGEELNQLLDALAYEIVDANIYHRLFCSLVDSISTNQKEFRQSNTFWGLTLDALREARLTRLCRIYDQESNGLNLVNLLDTIKANLNLFEEEHFRIRLQGNAFIDSLAQEHRVPPVAELNLDIEFSSIRNPLVKKLMIWRNNIVAHKGTKVSLGKDQILADNPLSEAEMEQLLDRSFEIFNRYSSLYRASTWSRQIIGHDDYKSLLKFLNLGLKKWDEDLKKERRELLKVEAEQKDRSDA